MIWPGVWNRCNNTKPVGASLLAKAVGQSAKMLRIVNQHILPGELLGGDQA